MFGNRKESEEESSSAESESEDWEKREGRDANEDGIDASSGDPVEPEGDNWTPVTSRRRGSERLSSPSSIGWNKFNKVTVYAALADNESAMHNHDFSKNPVN